MPRAAPARPRPAKGTRADAKLERFARFATVPAAVASEGSPAMLHYRNGGVKLLTRICPFVVLTPVTITAC